MRALDAKKFTAGNFKNHTHNFAIRAA